MLLLACPYCSRLTRQENGKCPSCGSHIGEGDIANVGQRLAYEAGYMFCTVDGAKGRTGLEAAEKVEDPKPEELPKVWIVLTETRYRWEGHEIWQPDVTEKIEISVGGVFDNQQAAHDFVRSQGSKDGVHFHVESHDLQSK